MGKGIVAGYILTGGKNRRMNGRTKAFLPMGEEMFLQRIQRALQLLPLLYLSVDQEVFYQEKIKELGIFENDPINGMVEDRYQNIGPIGGILSGMEALAAEGVEALFVTSSDCPFLCPEDVEALHLAYEKNPMLTLGETDGRIQPLLGIYPLSLTALMKEQILSGNYRMMDLCKGTGYQTVSVSEKSGININTPEEYEKWCR